MNNIVASDRHVAALFYEAGDRATDLILQLENIDDEADEFGIRFVKIRDRELAEEYSLAALPSLVYFRSGIPVVFTGDLSDEEDVLEWLIQHQVGKYSSPRSNADCDCGVQATQDWLHLIL